MEKIKGSLNPINALDWTRWSWYSQITDKKIIKLCISLTILRSNINLVNRAKLKQLFDYSDKAVWNTCVDHSKFLHAVEKFSKNFGKKGSYSCLLTMFRPKGRVSHRCWEHGWGGRGGGSSKFDGWSLSQYMGEAWGDLKCCWKIPVMEFIW